GTVYQGKGTASAAFGSVVAARNVASREGEKCPCLVFSMTTDKGKTWTESVLARADQWNASGTVRYPVSAASPAKAGNYAVAVYQPNHNGVTVYYTADGAKTWKSASPKPIP